MKSYLLVVLLFSSTCFAKQLTWAEIESELLGSGPAIQRDEFNAKAEQHLAKTGLVPFLPDLAVVGGVGTKDTVDSPEKGTQGYLRGRWNLFRGFKDSANQARLKTRENLSYLSLDIAKKRQVLIGKEIYYSLLMLDKQGEILKQELEVNTRQKVMASRKVSAGLTSSVDTIEFELRENTILAHSRKVQTETEKKRAELKSILNIAEAESVEVIGRLVIPRKESLALPSQNLARIQQAQYELDIAAAESRAIKAEYLPEINLEAQFGRLTLQNSLEAKNDETNYLLSVTIPLFSGLDTYYKSRAQAERFAAAQKEVLVRKLEIEKDISTLKAQWSEAWTLYELNEQALKRITKYYDLTLSEYKRGVKNSPDVVSATERFFEKQSEQVELIKELNSLEAQFQNFY